MHPGHRAGRRFARRTVVVGIGGTSRMRLAPAAEGIMSGDEILTTIERPAASQSTPASISYAAHLDALESEAIHILREVAAEFRNPVLLFSGGKDSTVLLRLAEKALRPGRLPFPLLHVDTGHNFPEVIAFRDRRVAEL